MAKDEDLTGRRFGTCVVIERAENFRGQSDIRKQYMARCDCDHEFVIVARNLKRYKDRHCPKCNVKRVKKGFKYGRNANGFVDKNIIVMEMDGKMVEIEKVKSAKCGKCKSSLVYKSGDSTICNGCSTVFTKGKESPKNKESFPKGHDPLVDTGDYIEGTVGVHEYK